MKTASIVVTLLTLTSAVGAQVRPIVPPTPVAPIMPLPPVVSPAPVIMPSPMPMISDFDFSARMPMEFHFQEGWSQPDPADSLYRVAYESMNRGEWRRAADLFAQVQEKYPRSNRLVSSAYWEAFNNYRIGTLESLRTAYRVLTEKTKGATSSATQSEIASLTTRVRGALAAKGDSRAQTELE
jgi:hypothetical protein